MRSRWLIPAFVVLVLASARVTWAAPITFSASGSVGYVWDMPAPGAPLVLEAVSVGTPWQLDVTFDPDTPGRSISPTMPTTFDSPNAVIAAEFTLGDFRYTNDGSTATRPAILMTNIGLPIGAGPGGFAGEGLVQFQFFRGWEGGEGGPDLNAGYGFLIASWNDVNAVDGSLPAWPQPADDQATLAGLLFTTFEAPWAGDSGFAAGYLPIRVDEPLPTPEPASILLLAAGLAAVAGRVRSSRRSRDAEGRPRRSCSL